MEQAAARFVVSLTRGKEDAERATVAMTMAVTAAASGKEAILFVSINGVDWSLQGSMDGVAVEGLTPLAELYEQFSELGGKIWACTPCFMRRHYQKAQLWPNAELIGGATVVEALSSGAPSLSY